MSNPQPHSDSALRITEIFYSLQGEARTVGLPTVFVRLTGCPLRCVYCDTEYAFSGGTLFSAQQICDQVAEHSPRYVTVTGGEPLASLQSFQRLRQCQHRKSFTPKRMKHRL